MTVVLGLTAPLVIAAAVGLGYLMYRAYDWAPEGVVPATVRLRDIAFVVLAVETLIVMILVLIISILMITILVLLYDRVIPALEQLNRTMNTVADTVHTVRGTTTFVSDKVVHPVIEVSSWAAGASRVLRGVRDLFPKGKRSTVMQDIPAAENQAPTSPIGKESDSGQ